MGVGFLMWAIILLVGEPTTAFQADVAYMCGCIFSVFGIFLLFAILSFGLGITKKLMDA